jgi:hypothetical protein
VVEARDEPQQARLEAEQLRAEAEVAREAENLITSPQVLLDLLLSLEAVDLT